MTYSNYPNDPAARGGIDLASAEYLAKRAAEMTEGADIDFTGMVGQIQALPGRVIVYVPKEPERTASGIIITTQDRRRDTNRGLVISVGDPVTEEDKMLTRFLLKEGEEVSVNPRYGISFEETDEDGNEVTFRIYKMFEIQYVYPRRTRAS